MKLAILTSTALILTAATANATPMVFEYLFLNTPVAKGTFTYATGSTGVLGYNDLTEFSLTVGNQTYTLNDISSLTNYQWFGYDTSTNSFVASDPDTTCGFDGCGFSASLGAIDDVGSSGFFFSAVQGIGLEYRDNLQVAFDSLVIFEAPEPTTWGMMLIGFTALGIVACRASRKAALAA